LTVRLTVKLKRLSIRALEINDLEGSLTIEWE